MDKIYQIYDKAYHQLFSNHELFRELLETGVSPKNRTDNLLEII